MEIELESLEKDQNRDKKTIENISEQRPSSRLTIADLTGLNLLKSAAGTMITTTSDIGSGIGRGIGRGIGSGLTMMQNGVVSGTTTVVNGTVHVVTGTVNIVTNTVTGTVSGVANVVSKTTDVVKTAITDAYDGTVEIITRPVRLPITDLDPEYSAYKNISDDDIEDADLLTNSEIDELTKKYEPFKNGDDTIMIIDVISDSDSNCDNENE